MESTFLWCLLVGAYLWVLFGVGLDHVYEGDLFHGIVLLLKGVIDLQVSSLEFESLVSNP